MTVKLVAATPTCRGMAESDCARANFTRKDSLNLLYLIVCRAFRAEK
jgi:hypothetical protein